jgi:hypothetical protein
MTKNKNILIILSFLACGCSNVLAMDKMLAFTKAFEHKNTSKNSAVTPGVAKKILSQAGKDAKEAAIDLVKAFFLNSGDGYAKLLTSERKICENAKKQLAEHESTDGGVHFLGFSKVNPNCHFNSSFDDVMKALIEDVENNANATFVPENGKIIIRTPENDKGTYKLQTQVLSGKAFMNGAVKEGPVSIVGFSYDLNNGNGSLHPHIVI